jgi:uncharacterized membrane protein YcaP (DUF421 family)
MHSVTHAVAIYIFLLLIFRLTGKRTLSQATNFDLVLLLIISETTQQAMVHNDDSVTNALLLITTLVGMSILLSILKQRFPKLDLLLEGAPLVLIDRGRVLENCMNRSRIDKNDILESARLNHGLERIDQIQYAVLERNGAISIIPKGKN